MADENVNDQLANLNKRLMNLNTNIGGLTRSIDDGLGGLGSALQDSFSIEGIVRNILNLFLDINIANAKLVAKYGVSRNITSKIADNMFDVYMSSVKYGVQLGDVLETYMQIASITRQRDFSGMEGFLASSTMMSKAYGLQSEEIGRFIGKSMLYGGVNEKIFSETLDSLRFINADLDIIGQRIFESSDYMSLFNKNTEMGNKQFRDLIHYSSVVNKNIRDIVSFSDQFRFFGESNDITAGLMQIGAPIDPLQMTMASYRGESEVRRVLMRSFRNMVGTPDTMRDPYVKNVFMLLGRTLGENYVELFDEFVTWNKYSGKTTREVMENIARDRMTILQKIGYDIKSIIGPGMKFLVDITSKVVSSITGVLPDKISKYLTQSPLRSIHEILMNVDGKMGEVVRGVTSLAITVLGIAASVKLISAFRGGAMFHKAAASAKGLAYGIPGAGPVNVGNIGQAGKFSKVMGGFWTVIKGMIGAAAGVAAIALSLMLLAKSFDRLSVVDWGSINKGKGVLFGLTGGLLALIAASSVLFRTPQGILGGIAGTVGALGIVGAISLSLNMLGWGLNKLGSANFSGLFQLGSGISSIGKAFTDVKALSILKMPAFLASLTSLGAIATIYSSQIKDLGIGMQYLGEGLTNVNSAVSAISIDKTKSVVKSLSELSISSVDKLFTIEVNPQPVIIELDGDVLANKMATYTTRIRKNRQ